MTNEQQKNGEITVDISQNDKDLLVRSYIDRYYLGVSKAMFEQVLKQTGNIKEALYDATLNEVANIALSEKMDSDIKKQEEPTDDE